MIDDVAMIEAGDAIYKAQAMRLECDEEQSKSRLTRAGLPPLGIPEGGFAALSVQGTTAEGGGLPDMECTATPQSYGRPLAGMMLCVKFVSSSAMILERGTDGYLEFAGRGSGKGGQQSSVDYGTGGCFNVFSHFSQMITGDAPERHRLLSLAVQAARKTDLCPHYDAGVLVLQLSNAGSLQRQIKNQSYPPTCRRLTSYNLRLLPPTLDSTSVPATNTMTVVLTHQTQPPPHDQHLFLLHQPSGSSQTTRPDGLRRPVHGRRAEMTLRSDLLGSSPSAAAAATTTTTNGETSRFATQGNGSPDRHTVLRNGERRALIALGHDDGQPGPSSSPPSPDARDDDLDSDRPRRPAKPQLLRSKSDFVPRQPDEDEPDDEIREWGARHGFEDHYQSEHIISQLVSNWYMYFTDKRHETTGKPKPLDYELQDWRQRDRLKTVSAALAVCLNIGVEPPDQLKTTPGAKLEAWTDPTIPPIQKALENIGKALQSQYETLAIRARYKQYLDPSVEETKKFCVSLRRNAKDERVLLHYNGHGVPKPTASGEIWVFNKTYTQYIPVSLYDLQHWLQAPTIFVWDCSEAGNILTNYHRFVEKHDEEEDEAAERDPHYERVNYRPYIHLAACAVKENLPTNPLLPADLFTACLTTPIEMALWFFVLQNPLKTNLTPERAKQLPGRLQERRTPLGELNWIFTAITDSIAWTTLPRDLFRKFFRQDLMVAALFRNFLLAQRVMTVYGCHPQSYPALPDTHQHPLWETWDLAVDMALAQLPMLERKDSEGVDYDYQNSTFFTEQLTAFDVYLTRGDAMAQKPPDQLPVVLQVLLSQQHRVRALILLGRFLDLGPWSVQLALSIGIFPYVLKLLQSAAAELKPVMVFIWARLIAVDLSCQQDLIKDSGYSYFAQILKPSEGLPVVDSDEHKAMCAFILAMLCKGYKNGQMVCNQTDIMTYCLAHLQNENNPLLRQWACLCISQLWQGLPEPKWRGIRENAYVKLAFLIRDPCCEVRAAMIHAMTTFLGIPDLTDEVARIEESIAWTILDMGTDGSPMVRREFLVFVSHFIIRFENKFLVTAYEQLQEEKDYILFPPQDDGQDHKMGLHYTKPENRNRDGTIKSSAHGLSHNTVYMALWKHALILSVDPHPEVQREATIVVDYVHNALVDSSIGENAQALMKDIQRRAKKATQRQPPREMLRNGIRGVPSTPPMTSPGLLRRTASLLFQSFIGGDDRMSPNGMPSPRQQPPRSVSAKIPADQVSAPPEQNDQFNAPAAYNVAREPLSGAFQERDPTKLPTIPLKSGFLEWSIEYFREPQMKASEADEPGSTEYNERLWRRARNETLLRETQPLKQLAGSHKWNNQLGMVNNGAQPAKMTFHQYEDHLAVSDDGNTVFVWDWKKQGRLSKFSNGNPEGSKISDMKFINEDDQAFLLTGSSDGVIRVYRNYDSDKTIELATSWRALTHMVPSNVNSGMVFDWQQVTGRVLVAGDVRVIRVWYAAHETCVMDVPARSGSCVTSLTSDQMTGNIFVAGFGDGAVRVFDTRERPQDSMVRKWKDESDRQWIKSVHMQRGGQRELLSASRNGKVKVWDIRMDRPLLSIQTTRDTLRTMSTHEHLPVFAVGTSQHTVKVFNLDGRELSRLEPYSSFLQQNRGGPISATAFHPHRPILGCAARGDYHISTFPKRHARFGRPEHVLIVSSQQPKHRLLKLPVAMADKLPPAAADDGEAGPSKKALKKAEQKAKKEAEKARRAAEHQASQAAAKAAAGNSEDLAKDNYGDVPPETRLESERLHIKDTCDKNVGKTVKVRAWIQNSRMQGAKMAFVELREEGDWAIQGVVAASADGTPVSRQMVKWIGGLHLESFVLVEGRIEKPLEAVKSVRVSGYELHINKCYVVAPGPEVLGMGLVVANKPVTNFDDEEAGVDEAASPADGLPSASMATHLNNPAMHKRAPVQQAIADVRMTTRKLFADYLDSKGFRQFEPPCLIGAASEGGSNVFGLPYFDKKAYLAQSPQFYKQYEIAGGRKRVYCIGPVFRAENSNTPRHMTEFTGLDLEMEIEESYVEVVEMLEGVLLHIFRGLAKQCAEQVALIRTVYPSEEFLLPEPGREVRLTFAEGQALLRAEGPAEFADVSDTEDMSTPQEKALGAVIRRKYKTDFYMLDKFPEGARPFYALEDPKDNSVTNAFDFFMRGQEILSGGQRIHDARLLEARIRKKGVDPASAGIKEYIDVFRSAGVPPHGGGGIGLDRVVAWYLNLPSVHLASYYPRTPKRLVPVSSSDHELASFQGDDDSPGWYLFGLLMSSPRIH
ncbi:hypothetical protein L249_2932, partial [Ophiocordyceps polyrhachis-furcata BCC 54312]